MPHKAALAIVWAVLTVALAAPARADDPPLTLELTFSQRALQELAGLSEMVTVSAFYFGEPAPGATIEPDEDGLIFLGLEEHVIWPVPQRLRLGANLAAMPHAQVVAPQVNVNIYSARFGAEDNLLDCGLIDGPVQDFAGRPQTIGCKLIGE
ncbi:hypothetical protein SAMN05421774_1013 [Gemmobacter megaterium]|uniref:Uncharacterized protein n=1 Tax=Gemmobacter megaterium TaxID=1086013 RepID=A0A1N7JQY7_9RHOB|nr:hypothetical protein [Gemmobacter megaterium]GGD98707.1 hypothetical protein GCM10011345_00020 [Gemmobacter megaterium]SIS51654.1 hypothetical protein SAMN05421774_1013 [Gemmobacter megaterium]